jgi:hypothetical protein
LLFVRESSGLLKYKRPGSIELPGRALKSWSRREARPMRLTLFVRVRSFLIRLVARLTFQKN